MCSSLNKTREFKKLVARKLDISDPLYRSLMNVLDQTDGNPDNLVLHLLSQTIRMEQQIKDLSLHLLEKRRVALAPPYMLLSDAMVEQLKASGAKGFNKGQREEVDAVVVGKSLDCPKCHSHEVMIDPHDNVVECTCKSCGNEYVVNKGSMT